MAAWQPPKLDTDGDLNRCQREILLLLPHLELHQDLMELRGKKDHLVKLSLHPPPLPARICTDGKEEEEEQPPLGQQGEVGLPAWN